MDPDNPLLGGCGVMDAPLDKPANLAALELMGVNGCSAAPSPAEVHTESTATKSFVRTVLLLLLLLLLLWLVPPPTGW